jgi:hypothetical protein
MGLVCNLAVSVLAGNNPFGVILGVPVHSSCASRTLTVAVLLVGVASRYYDSALRIAPAEDWADFMTSYLAAPNVINM